MEEKPRKIKSGGTDLPVVMVWLGEHRLCLTKEEAARRRPPRSSSTPVVYERIEVSPRHLLKTKSADAREGSDDAAPSARSDS